MLSHGNKNVWYTVTYCNRHLSVTPSKHFVKRFNLEMMIKWTIKYKILKTLSVLLWNWMKMSTARTPNPVLKGYKAGDPPIKSNNELRLLTVMFANSEINFTIFVCAIELHHSFMCKLILETVNSDGSSEPPEKNNSFSFWRDVTNCCGLNSFFFCKQSSFTSQMNKLKSGSWDTDVAVSRHR